MLKETRNLLATGSNPLKSWDKLHVYRKVNIWNTHYSFTSVHYFSAHNALRKSCSSVLWSTVIFRHVCLHSLPSPSHSFFITLTVPSVRPKFNHRVRNWLCSFWRRPGPRIPSSSGEELTSSSNWQTRRELYCGPSPAPTRGPSIFSLR